MSAKPDQPSFNYEIAQTEGYPKAKITWRPNVASPQSNPGSHFYVRYRKKGEPSFINSQATINEEFSEVGPLETDATYEFQVVAVDGDEETPSASTFVTTSDNGKIKVFFSYDK